VTLKDRRMKALEKIQRVMLEIDRRTPCPPVFHREGPHTWVEYVEVDNEDEDDG